MQEKEKEQSKCCGGGRLGKGLAAGLIGGLVASWAMIQFQTVWIKLSASRSKKHGKGDQQQAASGESQEPITVKIASRISTRVFHHGLTPSEKKPAGLAVDYAVGTSIGGIYGAVAEVEPRATRAAGLPFGAIVWLGADEIGAYALGLSKPPTQYPISVHVYALASHLVYGMTTEMVRRTLRRAWGRTTKAQRGKTDFAHKIRLSNGSKVNGRWLLVPA